MNINLCETCLHWRDGRCDAGFTDPALCGGWYELFVPLDGKDGAQ